MKAQKLMVHWHVDESDTGKGAICAIFSASFQSTEAGNRLATGGQDCNIRIWKLDDETNKVHYLSTLRKHTQTVNVVRFDTTGKLLASAGDDGMIFIWELNESAVQQQQQKLPEFGSSGNNSADQDTETWIIKKGFSSGPKEIYDLAWSPDSKHLIVGSLESTARVFDVNTGQCVLLDGHEHYVQGVVWDPLDEYVVTQSADRSICVYQQQQQNNSAANNQYTNCQRIAKFETPSGSRQNLYYGETLKSFFRRLTFSPEGSLLFTPAGILKEPSPTTTTITTTTTTNEVKETTKELNTVFIYTRAGIQISPAACVEGLETPALVIKCCPRLFATSAANSTTSLFALPYKLIYAVATAESVYIYSNEQPRPLCVVKNMHYLPITDLAWTSDGQTIIVTSMDGVCSVIRFEGQELGQPLDIDAIKIGKENNTVVRQNIQRPSSIKPDTTVQKQTTIITTTTTQVKHTAAAAAEPIIIDVDEADKPSEIIDVDSELKEKQQPEKPKRRIAPTLISK